MKNKMWSSLALSALALAVLSGCAGGTEKEAQPQAASGSEPSANVSKDSG